MATNMDRVNEREVWKVLHAREPSKLESRSQWLVNVISHRWVDRATMIYVAVRVDLLISMGLIFTDRTSKSMCFFLCANFKVKSPLKCGLLRTAPNQFLLAERKNCFIALARLIASNVLGDA